MANPFKSLFNRLTGKSDAYSDGFWINEPQRPHEATVKTTKRQSHSESEQQPDSKRSMVDNANIRRESRRLVKESAIMASVEKDHGTYIPPKGYIPQMGNEEDNLRVLEFIEAWMDNTEIFGDHHFLDMIEIIAKSRPRDGYVALHHVTPADESEGFLRTQIIHAEQIGHPNPKDCADRSKPEEIYPPIKDKNGETVLPKHLRCLYHGGLERENIGTEEEPMGGKVVRIHLFKRAKASNANEKNSLPVDKDGKVEDLGSGSSEHYVWDRAIDREDVWLFNDASHGADLLPAPDYQSAVTDIVDAEETVEALRCTVKAHSRRVGIHSGGTGDDSGADLVDQSHNSSGGDCGCGGDEWCSKCQVAPKKTVDESDCHWWRVPEGEDVTEFSSNTPSAETMGFIDSMMASPALSTHIAPGFAGIKPRRLQGTDIRVDLSKTQTEFTRQRCKMERQLLNKVIKAALEHGRASSSKPSAHPTVKALGKIDKDQIIRGKWQFPADLTADDGRSSDRLIREYETGLRSKDEIITMMGNDPRTVRNKRKENAIELLTDAKEVADETKCDFSVALALLGKWGPNDSPVQASVSVEGGGSLDPR